MSLIASLSTALQRPVVIAAGLGAGGLGAAAAYVLTHQDSGNVDPSPTGRFVPGHWEGQSYLPGGHVGERVYVSGHSETVGPEGWPPGTDPSAPRQYIPGHREGDAYIAGDETKRPGEIRYVPGDYRTITEPKPR